MSESRGSVCLVSLVSRSSERIDDVFGSRRMSATRMGGASFYTRKLPSASSPSTPVPRAGPEQTSLTEHHFKRPRTLLLTNAGLSYPDCLAVLG